MQLQQFQQNPPVLFNAFADNLFRQVIRGLTDKLNDEDSTYPQGEIELKPELVAGLPAYTFKVKDRKEQAWVVYSHNNMDLGVWLGNLGRGPDYKYEDLRDSKVPNLPSIDYTNYGHRFMGLSWMIEEMSEWVLDYLFTGKLPEVTSDTYVRPEPDLVGFVDESEGADED